MGKLQMVLAAALLTSACSGGGSPATTTTTVAEAAPPQTTTEVTTTTTSTTTTTTTTTTSAPAPEVVAGQIGVVGCSNTAMAAAGYEVLSDLDLLSQGGLTAGSVAVWGNEGTGRSARYWGLYDERRPAGGYQAAWVQLCIREQEHEGSFNSRIEGWIERIIAEIEERDPGIPIWVSGVNTFEDGHVCRTIGPDGAAIAAEAADWAAATIDGVGRGPDLGPVLTTHLDPGESCHPNLAGQAVLGEQLVAFFDREA